jgi:hypothetical protein
MREGSRGGFKGPQCLMCSGGVHAGSWSPPTAKHTEARYKSTKEIQARGMRRGGAARVGEQLGKFLKQLDLSANQLRCADAAIILSRPLCVAELPPRAIRFAQTS